ncbi:hypothetical protein Q0Z83_098720 [Actinoplanes sichuanensis]|uniref:Peroxidase family protein n=1 Tax=Actinoplanes sichuanensis TaxID=512349 RepID=A0ABW4AAE2_9ACTN|nr:peroxidase family protein [Actinoplanes sichuanensis]BEL11681.1 hypothetical protein Q0Z83_098720 [Actinoplanes sichuanensis]
MRRVWSAAALGALLTTTVMVVPAQAAPIGQGFTITQADLSYILKQIKIAEAHVAGTTSETGPCGALLDQLGSPMLSMGLRTVDGTCNHLTPGQERYGAADQEFPRLAPAQYSGVYQGTRPVDAAPRQISNIIADQTAANPAAVAVSGGNTDGVTLFIPNVTTDFGLSAPYNSWFTLFGQFFDHGIDQTVKGNDIVMVPLRADDPLVAGPDRTAGTADDPKPGDAKFVPPAMRFMMLTRAANPSKNTDTPYVDNSQTYTSHAAHQVFLREYGTGAKATGNLLGGAAGGLPTWADVKRQARDVLGLALSDLDALNVPMVLADAYGNLVPGPARGLPQYVTATGLVEGDLANPVAVPADVVHFDTPFLTDIAHNATPSKTLAPDSDTVASADFASQPAGTYDDEMLAAHYIAGDGRANENIGLTAVHQIFHSEHNRLVGDITRIIDGNPEWTGERIFQAAKFINEMEYQHLVFEEFARKIQPAINPFQPAAFTQTELDPAVYAEFAHAVYRFGHSMLTETIQRPTAGNLSLLDGFLNPPAFTNGGTLSPEAAAGEIVMGMTEQVGNDLDEFMTDTLRSNLLGLPMDLGAINIARGRSEGIPTLNNLRRVLHSTTNDGRLRPYVSWIDFGEHLKHPESLVNFVAAYGRHPSILGATTVDAKRAAARNLLETPAGADFLNATGTWTTANSGLDDIDLWIGGLAETTEPFGGLLGSTFDYVFETQLTALQNGDRLYYLARTPGMNLRGQLEGNTFAELISRNTTAGGLRADVFATADCKFDMAALDGTTNGYSRQGNLVDDDPASECNERALLMRLPDGTIAYRARNSVDKAGMNAQSVFNGTENSDRILAGNDNDTIWGAEGDDVLEGGAGDDVTVGGEDDDILTDSGGADFSMGGPGNDAIDAGPGADIILGGDGRDFTNGGANANETFGGEGDDMIIAGDGEDSAFGDSGHDWMEGGDSPDLLSGDSGNLFFRDDSNKPGHDVLIGQGGDDDYDMEGGDDIGVQGPGIEKNAGGSGWDWSIAGTDTIDSDLDLPLLGLDGLDTGVRDRYDEVESLSGGPGDDVLRGDDSVPATDGAIGCDALDATGIARIRGLDQVVTELPMPATGVVNRTGRPCDLIGNVWGEGNILLGGAGDDLIQGRLGDDIIDGDRHLTARLAVRGTSITASSLAELRADVFAGKINPNDITVVREIASSPTPGRDTAVFAGARAEYSITPISGGVLVSGPDGNDLVRNVELLHFDDEIVDIAGMSAFLGVSAFAGDGRATVLITVPDATGGEPITGLTLERTGTGGTVSTSLDPSTRSLVVTGLTNGEGYTFRVRADTAAGPGVFTAPFGPVTPVAAVPGDDDPAEPGENEEEPAPNPVPTTTPPVVTPTTTPPVVTPTTTPPVVTPTTAPPTTTPPVVTPPRPVTPVAPDAPAIGAATGGDESALVRWVTPLYDGGTPIYGYEVQALDAETGIVIGVDVADAGATEMTMTGLTNGMGYAFWVRAVNAAGASAYSGISNTVVPAASVDPGTTDPGTTDPGTTDPGTTDPGTGNPGTGNPGTGNPGTTTGPVTPTPTVTTTVTPTPTPTRTATPGPTVSPTRTTSPGPTSPSPTGSVTPTPSGPGSTPDTRTVPGAARIGRPAPAEGAAVVRWTAPIDNGGSPIRRYEIQVSKGDGRQSGALRTAPAAAGVQTVTDLVNGTAYRFRVRAVNALGAGPWSDSSTLVTPRTVPGKARDLTAKPGGRGGKLTTTIRWTAPAATGGSKITGYRITWQRLNAKGNAQGAAVVTTVPAGAGSASLTAPAEIPTNTRYRATVQAVNAAGAGPGAAVSTTVR